MAGSAGGDSSFGQLLAEADRGYAALLRAEVAGLGIFEAAVPVLLTLLRSSQEWSLAELAAQVGVSPSAMSLTVNRLERDGLARRERGADRRSKVVVPTDLARALRHDVMAAHERCEAAALEGLGSDDRERLRGLINRLTRPMAEGFPKPREPSAGDDEDGPASMR